jgi:hypothetical protein
LEDVLQRIERHFRGEQAVRREAEEAERDASSELVHERELRVRLEEEARGQTRGASDCAPHTPLCLQLRVRSAETKQTDVLLASLAAEHAAVEDECKRAEQELAVARSEAWTRSRRDLALRPLTPPAPRRRRRRSRRSPRRRRACARRRRWSCSSSRRSTTRA